MLFNAHKKPFFFVRTPTPPKGGLLCFPSSFKCQWLRPVGACPRPLKIEKILCLLYCIVCYLLYEHSASVCFSIRYTMF